MSRWFKRQLTKSFRPILSVAHKVEELVEPKPLKDTIEFTEERLVPIKEREFIKKGIDYTLGDKEQRHKNFEMARDTAILTVAPEFGLIGEGAVMLNRVKNVYEYGKEAAELEDKYKQTNFYKTKVRPVVKYGYLRRRK